MITHVDIITIVRLNNNSLSLFTKQNISKTFTCFIVHQLLSLYTNNNNIVDTEQNVVVKEVIIGDGEPCRKITFNAVNLSGLFID